MRYETGLTRDFAIASVKIGTEIRLSKGRRSFPTSHDFINNSAWYSKIQTLSSYPTKYEASYQYTDLIPGLPFYPKLFLSRNTVLIRILNTVLSLEEFAHCRRAYQSISYHTVSRCNGSVLSERIIASERIITSERIIVAKRIVALGRENITS